MLVWRIPFRGPKSKSLFVTTFLNFLLNVHLPSRIRRKGHHCFWKARAFWFKFLTYICSSFLHIDSWRFWWAKYVISKAVKVELSLLSILNFKFKFKIELSLSYQNNLASAHFHDKPIGNKRRAECSRWVERTSVRAESCHVGKTWKIVKSLSWLIVIMIIFFVIFIIIRVLPCGKTWINSCLSIINNNS